MKMTRLGVALLGMALTGHVWAAGVLIEAENFSAQEGGQVGKNTDRPGSSGGACVTAMDDAGHWLAWKVDVPETGDYRVMLRYAAGRKWVVWRELQIDGKVPVESLAKFDLAPTGGWGRAASDWRNLQLNAADGTPLTLHLVKGEHVLRLTNKGGAGENGSANLDAIVLTTGDTASESLLKL